MKKAVITGERRAELVEVPDPEPKQDWVLVKVHAAPMCTEYKNFIAGQTNEFLGHEAAGEVVAVAQPGSVKAGDRVVVMPQYPCGRCSLCISGEFIHCERNYDFEAFVGGREGRAAYAQYLLKPAWLLPKIPDGVSYEDASLTLCALGPTFGACDLLDVDASDTVLIAGAGPVGLGGVVNACFRGARVFVVESVPYRMARARLLGAEQVIDPGRDDCLEQILDLTAGRGVDKALDCTGVVQAQRLCIDALRRKGRMAFVGAGNGELKIRDWSDMITKGLVLYGSWHYNLSRFPAVLKVVQDSPAIADLVSHIIPMSQIQTAFELSASRTCAKIILKPWA